MNDKHYNKKWRKEMGGHTHMDGEFVRGESSTGNEEIRDAIEASYNSLNLAIDRLDKIIHEFVETCPCKDNKSD
jgi:hypothetical protein